MLKAVVKSQLIHSVKAEVTTNILGLISAEINSSIVGGVYKKYEGSYLITPTLTSQTLPTKERSLKEDIIIYPIPIRRFENEYGGETVIIG